MFFFSEIVKSASESSLSEACDDERNKKDSNKTVDDEIEDLKLEASSERRKSSLAATKSLHELKSVGQGSGKKGKMVYYKISIFT